MATTRRKWSSRSYTSTPEENARRAAAPSQEIYVRALRSRAPGQPTDSRLEQSRHQQGAVHVAINVLGSQAASCLARVKRRKPDDDETPDQDNSEPVPYGHELSRLMRRPNGKETGGMLRRRMVQQLCLTGSALLWRLLDGTGTPAELWNIPSGTWQPLMRSPSYPEGAYRVTPYYAYGPFATVPGLMQPGGVVIPSEEIVRADFPHPLVTYDAYSPLTACALQLDALEMVDRSRMYGMRQGINPSATYDLPPEAGVPDPAEIDRLKEELNAKLGGPENTGRVVVTTGGGKLSPYSHSPADMMWESSWSQLVDFVLSVFGTTKTISFMSEASSYAALYAALKQFNLLSLVPLMQLLADAINVQLIWPHWGEEYFVEFEPRRIDDAEDKRQNLSLLTSVGGLTFNELRAALELEPTDEPWGAERAYTGQAQAKLQQEQQREQQAAQAQAGGVLAPGQPPGQPDEITGAMDSPGAVSEGSLPDRQIVKRWQGNGRH